MNENKVHQVSIVGGGLAGLGLSIQLAQMGYTVVLFEKETYPFHKVCGEYISLESWPFLQSLGLPLQEMDLPTINKLQVTAPDGTSLETILPLGGFGISRYKLDCMLRDLAILNGVKVLENTKVTNVNFEDEQFTIHTSAGIFHSIVCCGCYGKKSNLDVLWKRPFTLNNARRLNQFVGVKYHIETAMPNDLIALHNFENGYCGISKIEDNRYCLCYLTHAHNLKSSGQSIEKMEENILCANPHLKRIFLNSKKLFTTPVSISQVSFLPKSKVENHVLLLGDAAGLITPLCGNGMSMALHTSKLVASLANSFLRKEISRAQMETDYIKQWNLHFSNRLRIGRAIQYFFGKNSVTNLFIKLMKRTPALSRWLIKQTHGKPF